MEDRRTDGNVKEKKMNRRKCVDETMRTRRCKDDKICDWNRINCGTVGMEESGGGGNGRPHY